MKIHGVTQIVLSGGSAFGLDCAGGVMRYLSERNIGFPTDVIHVPIVCQAVLFDLQMLDTVQPLPNYGQMGYEACCAAEIVNSNGGNVLEGNVGAGTGAVIGKMMGKERAMKGGLGTFAIRVGNLRVGCVVAVNCFGDVYEKGRLIAGCLNEQQHKPSNEQHNKPSSNEPNDNTLFADSELLLIQQYLTTHQDCNVFNNCCSNTTIAIVVTNARFDKTQLNRIATMAHDGYARSMKPSHTLYDGDTIFVVSTEEMQEEVVPVNLVGTLAARVVEEAVVRGVKRAETVKGYKAFKDL